MKKYELVKKSAERFGNHKIYRIRALKDILEQGVKKGDLGGFVESENNLSHQGHCWIQSGAYVIGDAEVRENALVDEFAMVAGKSILSGEACVRGHVCISLDTKISGDALIESMGIHPYARI